MPEHVIVYKSVYF